ncbi:MAG: patatin-like phospholipase family protein [bacterium]
MAATKHRLALVLGGGGAPGMAHLGVLEVLQRESIKPDLIVGGSIGSIIGALYALEPDVAKLRAKVEDLFAADEISDRWRNLSGETEGAEGRFYEGLLHFFQRQLIGLKVFATEALRPAAELQQPLDYLFGKKTFADLKLPLAAAVLDIVAGEELLLTKGRLTEALYASAAIPGIFPPSRQGGRVLVDGAFTSSCQVGLARRLGVESIIGVRIPTGASLSQEFETGIDVLARTDEIVRSRLTDLETQDADVLIVPATEAIHWADFDSRERAIALGREAAEAKLPELKALVRKRRGGFWSRLFWG